MHPESDVSKPEVAIFVELHDSLDSVLKGNTVLHQAACQKIAQSLSDLLEILGIPGKPSVSLGSLPGNTPLQEAILRLYVNGLICRYPDELMQRVYWYIKGLPLGSVEGSAPILGWLIGLAGTPNKDQVTYTDLVDFLGLICQEIIKRQPAVLLGQPQLETYLSYLRNTAEMPEPTIIEGLPDQDWLLPALAQVLNLRTSIADTSQVTQIMFKAWQQKRSWEDAAEDLMVALRPGVVEIQLPLDYLQEITSDDSKRENDVFTMLRDGLFYEDGLCFPDFRFEPVNHLKPNSFVFKMNHLTCTPRVGLRPGEYLVNEIVDRLPEWNLKGQAVINPANLNDCSFVASEVDPAKADLYSWNPLEYLVLSFSADLRENYASLVDRDLAKSSLDKLSQAFPELVATTNEIFSLEDITRVLRHLLSERLGIRNLRAILEALIDIDYLVISSEYIVFDRRLALTREPEPGWQHNSYYLTSYVRRCLKEQISKEFSYGGNTLKVFLLDPEIERLVSEHENVPAGEAEKTPLTESRVTVFLTEVQQEVERMVGTNAPDYSMPAVLTIGNVRQHIRQLLAPQFPRLPVLAYEELAPHLNIQLLSRIPLGSL